jgi:hypothetical protein
LYLTSWTVSVLHATVLAYFPPLDVFLAFDASDPWPRGAGRTDVENRLDVLKQSHGLRIEWIEFGKSRL